MDLQHLREPEDGGREKKGKKRGKKKKVLKLLFILMIRSGTYIYL